MQGGNLINKHFIVLLILLSVTTSASSSIIAKEKPLAPIIKLNGKIEYNKVHPENLSEMSLDLSDGQKHKLKESKPKELDDVIKLTPEEIELKKALQIQKGKDVEDIKMLWDATVAKNPVIRFALEKVSTPPQQRQVKSSMMARSIATMLQGAAIVPSLFGMGMMTEYGGAFGGQLLANAFAKKFVPQPGMPSITEPELIQLTALIEDLQEEIINSYYNYKSSLESLSMEKKNFLIQERNYKKALESKDKTSIIIASALYDKAKQSKIRLKQQVKIHRIQLERLAGLEAVSALNLALADNVLQAKFSFEDNAKNAMTQPIKTPADVQDTPVKPSKEDINLHNPLIKPEVKINNPLSSEKDSLSPSSIQNTLTNVKSTVKDPMSAVDISVKTPLNSKDLEDTISEIDKTNKEIKEFLEKTEKELNGVPANVE